MKKKLLMILTGLALAVGVSSCGTTTQTGTQSEKDLSNQANNRIVRSVGYPDTSNAMVKKMLRLTYELADRGTDTYTYYRIPYTGELRLVCPSFGYPSAYSTQYSRPEEATWRTRILPQAEPDGTYKPGSHSATYYLCKGDAGLYLEYEEAEISASIQRKETVSQDTLVGTGTVVLTYEELQQLKQLNGDQLGTFLRGITDRLESQVGS